jgi:hypothetical protein
MRRLVFALLLLVAACGDATTAVPDSSLGPATSDQAIAIVASSDLAVGPQRLLLALASPNGTRLGSPELAATVTVFPEADPAAATEVAAQFVWAIPGSSGMYRAAVDFDREGIWLAQLATASGPQPAAVLLSVGAVSATPGLGTTAPRSESPTAGDAAAIAAISTDTEPLARMYEMSIADAVASGRPSVIVFATPKFCQTAVCGPVLELVKELAPAYPDVNFIHVEVYDLEASPAGATSIEELVVAPAVMEWGLISEPWVFVVDAAGNISGRFEGVVDAAEITALLG